MCTAMHRTISIALIVTLSLAAACGDNLEPPIDECATDVDAGVSIDAPVGPTPSCPPWFPACPAGALRALECQATCASWTCAGFTVDECRADCEAYRWDAYCPGL
jgi:hypothetical protein